MALVPGEVIECWQEPQPNGMTNLYCEVRPCNIPEYYDDEKIAILEKMTAESIYRIRKNATQVSVAIFFALENGEDQ